MKENACCFTGHRPIKLLWGYDEEREGCILLKRKLAVQIEEMRRKGVVTFYTGMAQGVDVWAAEAVLALKLTYPQEGIRLIAVIPYEGQANRWSADYRERYFNILADVDDDVLLHPHYTRGCMHERNCYMVDHSTRLIAVFNGEAGGTRNTVEYARKKGLEIVTIHLRDVNVKTAPRFRGFTLLK